MGTKEDIQFAISSLLDERDVKKSELADAIGVSRAAVTNWTNGSNSIDIEMVPAICDFFDVSIDEFFGRRAPGKLSYDEELLLSYFRGMNAQGRSALLASAEGLFQAFSEKSSEVSKTA